MYLNTFINLEENITGYGKNARKPSGHTIITMPGMIRLYLQDLKELSDKEYICYALSKKDNKAVRIGAINPPSESKMTNWRIDINNVLGKGVRADNIDCIAIVIEGDTVGNTDTIMLGYVGEKYLITPLLEKGLPKQEVKVTSEERKDKTPTTPAKPVPKPEVKPVPKPEVKPMPKPEVKPVPKSEVKPMPKPEVKPMPKPVEKPEPVILPEYEPAILLEPKPCKPVEEPKLCKPAEEPKPCKPVERPKPCKSVEGPGPVILQKPIEEAEVLNKFKNKEQKEKENLKQIINQLNESKIDEKEVKKEVEKLKELKKLVKKEIKEEPVKQPIGEMEILNKFKNKEQKEKENLKQIINKLNEEKAEEKEEVIKKEIKEKSIKKQCGCHKGHKKDIIQEIIEVLERNESNTKDISQAIEDELKELITTGISRDEILNKKNELELQIKDLLNDKLSVRDNREEKEIENQLKSELNKQFEMGYKLDRSYDEYEEIVDTTEEQEQRIESQDKDIEEREQRMEDRDKGTEEQGQRTEDQEQEIEEQEQRMEEQDREIEKQGKGIEEQEQRIEEQEQRIEEQETTIEEVDFLEQLEEKLKGLQALLKTNTNESNKEEPNEGVGDIRGSKKVDENKEVSTQKEEYSRIKEIFESSVEIEPFDTETKPIDWVRISLAELISIPQIDYEWAIQPFITFSYHKFNHLILGKDREVNQYYIGIPDIYHQTRNHILEIDKIERFVCRSSDKLETGEPGYWIAMI